MILLPSHIQASYDYLRAFTPFSRWKLPHGDEIAFKVIADKKLCGYYQHLNGEHWIGVSTAWAGAHSTLLKITAHEMLHLKQKIHGTETKSQHNAEFKRLAGQVCRAFQWDSQDFYF